MKNPYIIFIVALLTAGLSVFSGCKKEQSTTSGTSPASASPQPDKPVPAKHASANVIPGSHEDWCGEHQVPESQCTKCNPKLIAAFKATNDWCNEHGLPESQCLQCNPELKIQRPPKKEGAR